jgi:hypothetical protein
MAVNAVASGGASPSTTIPGLAERNRAVVARAGIGTGLLPFTGLNARALLVAAAALLCIGGWLLVWAGRVQRARAAR